MVGSSQIPFLVAGCGGYYDLSGFKKGSNGQKPRTPVSGTDASGNEVTLECFNDSSFGYLLLTVSATQLKCKLVGVDTKTKATSVLDHFTLDLAHHTINNH